MLDMSTWNYIIDEELLVLNMNIFNNIIAS